MGEKIRVGIIGTGNWTETAHIPAFRENEERAEVVALCDEDLSRAKRVGEKFGISAVYNDLETMLTNEKLDVLDIVTSRGEHYKPACSAIAHGLHILTEKPVGHTLEEAADLAKRIKGKGIIHHVGFTFRYSPVVRKAKELIDSGVLGTIYHVQGFEQNGQLVDEATPLPRRGFSPKTDSGALHGYGSHLIDLCRWLCGEVTAVIGQAETYIKHRPVLENPEETMEVTVDDSTIWLCRYENGAQGVMQASKVAIGEYPGVEIRVYGSKASLWLRLAVEGDGYDRLWMATRENMEFRPVDVPNDFPDNDWPRNYFSLLVRDFLRRVEEHDEAPGSGDYFDGLHAQEIIKAIEVSAERKTWVDVAEFTAQ